MKRLAGLSLLALSLTSLGGCGWVGGDKGYFRDRGGDYLTAQEEAPMRLPEGVQARALDPLLPIPQHVATAHAAGKFEVPRPYRLQASADVSDFSVQQQGNQRWLLAQRTPTQVWTSVRQYFVDNGLGIESEDAQSGEFVTRSRDSNEISPRLRQALGLPAGQFVQVLVRVEPGVQRGTSEVFLQTQLRSTQANIAQGWQAPYSSNAQDVILLERLAQDMGRSAKQGDSTSLVAERNYDAPDRTQILSTSSGLPELRMDTDFDRAWSSVGRALQTADIKVDDLNRTNGVYFINPAESASNKPGFFKRWFGGSKATAERYELHLLEQGNQVIVSLQSVDSKAPITAEQARSVLKVIEENLN